MHLGVGVKRQPAGPPLPPKLTRLLLALWLWCCCICRVSCRPLRPEPKVSANREQAVVCDPEFGGVVRIASREVSCSVPAPEQGPKFKHTARQHVLLFDGGGGRPCLGGFVEQVPAVCS